jgi:phospholipid N-methyltransferase
MNRTRTEPRPWLDRLQEQLRLPPTSGLLFFLQFLSNPKGVGAIVPTSRAAVDGLLRHVDWATCRLFVEYGPGTGAFTRHVLKRAHPDARIIAIDPNPRFVDHLRHSLFDPRLTVVQGSAADVEDILASHGGEKADYILSGLPFSTLPEGLADMIVSATERALVPGGAFLVYQYSLFILPALRSCFADVVVGREWLCIPPARLMRAYKGEG